MMKEITLDSSLSSPQDIVNAMNFHCTKVIDETSTEVWKKWREKVDNSTNNHISGKYRRVLICSYRDLCDCNAKMKLEYSIAKHSISLLWYTFGFSHAMSSRLNNRFMSFESHKSFKHTRFNHKSEFDPNIRSTYMTIELKEKVEETLINSPTMSPESLIKEMQKSFPTYSQRYWVLARKSIRSYRLTLKKVLKRSGPSSATYHNDSFNAIRGWVSNNTYDVISQRNDFDLFSLFVAAHEIEQDMSAPPIDSIERSNWTPKHKIRIVLCSIAMSLNFPILQLKPSLHRYLCVSADSTFKLAIFKLIKVSLH